MKYYVICSYKIADFGADGQTSPTHPLYDIAGFCLGEYSTPVDALRGNWHLIGDRDLLVGYSDANIPPTADDASVDIDVDNLDSADAVYVLVQNDRSMEGVPSNAAWVFGQADDWGGVILDAALFLDNTCHIIKEDSKMKVINCVGGHSIRVYSGATYDPSIRKYRGGEVALEIPSSGKMLSARLIDTPAEPLSIGGVEIPTISRRYNGVDELPDDGNLYIVSALYVAAVQSEGGDTSRLLTIGNPVVDDKDRVIGCTCLIRN